jgi:hypothetical protein
VLCALSVEFGLRLRCLGDQFAGPPRMRRQAASVALAKPQRRRQGPRWRISAAPTPCESRRTSLSYL